MTDGKEKFIWDSVSGKEWFFDLHNDPQELQNLIDHVEYTASITRWRRRLIDILATRPEDGLTDGNMLISGKACPVVRPYLLATANL